MLIALGNEEVLRHLNHQEDWLKTAVISKNRILSKTECRWHYIMYGNFRANLTMKGKRLLTKKYDYLL